MAHDRAAGTRSESAAPPDPGRRNLLALGWPALASLSVAAGSLTGQRNAAAAERPESQAGAPEDAGTLTPQRQAYYRRARF